MCYIILAQLYITYILGTYIFINSRNIKYIKYISGPDYLGNVLSIVIVIVVIVVIVVIIVCIAILYWCSPFITSRNR